MTLNTLPTYFKIQNYALYTYIRSYSTSKTKSKSYSSHRTSSEIDQNGHNHLDQFNISSHPHNNNKHYQSRGVFWRGRTGDGPNLWQYMDKVVAPRNFHSQLCVCVYISLVHGISQVTTTGLRSRKTWTPKMKFSQENKHWFELH